MQLFQTVKCATTKMFKVLLLLLYYRYGSCTPSLSIISPWFEHAGGTTERTLHAKLMSY